MKEVAIVLLGMLLLYIFINRIDKWLHDDDDYYISKEQIDKIINRDKESKHEDNSSSTGS